MGDSVAEARERDGARQRPGKGGEIVRLRLRDGFDTCGVGAGLSLEIERLWSWRCRTGVVEVKREKVESSERSGESRGGEQRSTPFGSVFKDANGSGIEEETRDSGRISGRRLQAAPNRRDLRQSLGRFRGSVGYEDEIDKMVSKLEEKIQELEDGSCMDALVLPLHGSLPPEMQALHDLYRVFL
ncbi:hypothetical protein MA16_Dca021308 [Dendrobium catenatum]|uniref:Uncharacterized protein n=1 Tax=Dendrobium catenatum TaxID=906689 RepID=A0A2I0VYU5_9ASPA|nr:hypothetical protein MA16_Dca021308 [Dendrobium catenatum]